MKRSRKSKTSKLQRDFFLILKSPAKVIAQSAALTMKFPYQDDPTSISDLIRSNLECEGNLSLRDCLAGKTTLELISASQNLGEFPFGLYGITQKDVNKVESDLLIGFNTGDSFQVKKS